MIEAISYKSINNTRFASSIDCFIGSFGNPETKTLRRNGGYRLIYDGFSAFFSPSEYLFEEITIYKNTITSINSNFVDWSTAGFIDICRDDGDPFFLPADGSIVLFNLGVGMYGIEDDSYPDFSLSLFQKGVWDRYRSKVKPFVI